jgi:hypothetical protein
MSLEFRAVFAGDRDGCGRERGKKRQDSKEGGREEGKKEDGWVHGMAL